MTMGMFDKAGGYSIRCDGDSNFRRRSEIFTSDDIKINHYEGD